MSRTIAISLGTGRDSADRTQPRGHLLAILSQRFAPGRREAEDRQRQAIDKRLLDVNIAGRFVAIEPVSGSYYLGDEFISVQELVRPAVLLWLGVAFE